MIIQYIINEGVIHCFYLLILYTKAYVQMVRMEQQRAEAERKREEEQRKKLKEQAKRRARILEAAFDGNMVEIHAVLGEV